VVDKGRETGEDVQVSYGADNAACNSGTTLVGDPAGIRVEVADEIPTPIEAENGEEPHSGRGNIQHVVEADVVPRRNMEINSATADSKNRGSAKPFYGMRWNSTQSSEIRPFSRDMAGCPTVEDEWTIISANSGGARSREGDRGHGNGSHICSLRKMSPV
jgi:hypothetical protein